METAAREATSLKVEVSNGKVIPVLWIDIRYFENKPNFLADDAELDHHITWLLSKQSASWTEEFKAGSRGVAVMQSVSATSGDGFGLCSEKREYRLAEPAMIVVYPRVFAVDTNHLIRMNSGLLASDQGCMEDNTFFKGIHDYQTTCCCKAQAVFQRLHAAVLAAVCDADPAHSFLPSF